MTNFVKTPLKFTLEKRLPGLGRAGIIHTAHGDIKTPAFLAVGTHGSVKYLSPTDLRAVGAQAMLSNAYHLRSHAATIAAAGGLSQFAATNAAGSLAQFTSIDAAGSLAQLTATNEAWGGPTFTDSGGFQVMSLGSGLGKVVSMKRTDRPTNTAHAERLAHVSDRGVNFTDPFTGQPDFIDPEESMRIQCQIGADVHMAFDELTSLADDYAYNVQALTRTEAWAERSLAEHRRHALDLGYPQYLYGVLQGGHWEDLRRSTAARLSAMGFDGYGLGGAFLKEQLGEILTWCNEILPESQPRHLLGLSHPDDIFVGVENGADTFDCVAPTREARHGKIYTLRGSINLRKFADSPEPLDPGCDCSTCQAGWTRSQLRALWRSGDPAQKRQFYTLASAHNLRFIVRLTEQIRASILDGSYFELKHEFLQNYYGERSGF